MLITLIRYGIPALLILLVAIVISKSRIVPKKLVIGTLSVVTIFVWAILMLQYPPEGFLVTYPDPVTAYQFSHSGNTGVKIIEGKQSAMVVGLSREREVEFQVFPKTEDGWQLGTSWWVKHYSFVPENSEILIVIIRVKSSGDCYAWVTFPVRPDHAPTDARGSQYHSDSEVTGAFSTTYFAYIGRPSGTYTLTVDGVDYPLDGLPEG